MARLNTLRKIAAAAALSLAFTVQAADDPSIKGELRKTIHDSMNSFIQQQNIDGRIYVYDAVAGKLLKLKLDELHSGIVKKGDFYVSCADFRDDNGGKVDIDFLVRPSGEQLVTTQALVHSIDGKKRKYHLEKM
ncbi:MAG TPA: hypothetical protein ENJ65_03500 [Candidatus Tenderia electrophaga]|uniref:Uncharacterized protein n=1 Tax=Candidatus Tenderia electrophaga TaxID=1748243 RepID=A0A832N3Q6_9GAMM|nr:hypothetical protein [Candidatus Tenderia electrophaga]